MLSPSAVAFDPNAVKVRTAAADKQAAGRQLHVACPRVSVRGVLFFPAKLSCFRLVSWSAALKKIALL